MSMRGLSMSVLAFLFTAFFSAAIIVIGPGDFANRTLCTILLSPFVWGLAMFYCYWDELAWRPTAALSAVTAACAVVVFVFEVRL